MLGIARTGPCFARAAALAAKRLDSVFAGKFEDFDFQAHGIAPGSLDTVIVADVLEHPRPVRGLGLARALVAGHRARGGADHAVEVEGMFEVV